MEIKNIKDLKRNDVIALLRKGELKEFRVIKNTGSIIVCYFIDCMMGNELFTYQAMEYREWEYLGRYRPILKRILEFDFRAYD